MHLSCDFATLIHMYTLIALFFPLVIASQACPRAPPADIRCPLSDNTLYTPPECCVGGSDSFLLVCSAKYSGRTIKVFNGVKNAKTCIAKCTSTPSCVAMSYNAKTRTCTQRSTVEFGKAQYCPDTVFAYKESYKRQTTPSTTRKFASKSIDTETARTISTTTQPTSISITQQVSSSTTPLHEASSRTTLLTLSGAASSISMSSSISTSAPTTSQLPTEEITSTSPVGVSSSIDRTIGTTSETLATSQVSEAFTSYVSSTATPLAPLSEPPTVLEILTSTTATSSSESTASSASNTMDTSGEGTTSSIVTISVEPTSMASYESTTTVSTTNSGEGPSTTFSAALASSSAGPTIGVESQTSTLTSTSSSESSSSTTTSDLVSPSSTTSSTTTETSSITVPVISTTDIPTSSGVVDSSSESGSSSSSSTDVSTTLTTSTITDVPATSTSSSSASSLTTSSTTSSLASGETYTARDGSKWLVTRQSQIAGIDVPGVKPVTSVSSYEDSVELCAKVGTLCRAVSYGSFSDGPAPQAYLKGRLGPGNLIDGGNRPNTISNAAVDSAVRLTGPGGQRTELLQNGDFSSGSLGPWKSTTRSNRGTSYNVVNGAATATLNLSGGGNDNVMLSQDFPTLKSGSNYYMSFDYSINIGGSGASSANSCTMEVNFGTTTQWGSAGGRIFSISRMPSGTTTSRANMGDILSIDPQQSTTDVSTVTLWFACSGNLDASITVSNFTLVTYAGVASSDPVIKAYTPLVTPTLDSTGTLQSPWISQGFDGQGQSSLWTTTLGSNSITAAYQGQSTRANAWIYQIVPVVKRGQAFSIIGTLNLDLTGSGAGISCAANVYFGGNTIAWTSGFVTGPQKQWHFDINWTGTVPRGDSTEFSSTINCFIRMVLWMR